MSKQRTPDDKRAKRQRALSRRRATVERRCGMSLQEYDALLARQGGACDCCEHRFRGVLHADRDPATGRLLGLLCPGCVERVATVRHVHKYRDRFYAFLQRWRGEAYARAFLRAFGLDVPNGLN